MIKFGIIGTNWITESFVNAANELEDFSLAAVYSRTEEKAKEFADKFEVKTTYTDLDKFVASADIDAVYIASPNALHAEHAMHCMKNGKHVICEKSISSNTRELQNMIDTAKENKVLLMEALKTTFLPNFISIQENLHKIGAVRRYFASYCQYSSRYDAYKEGTVLNAFNPNFSNGSLMDIGIYCVYPMVALFGKPNQVKASSVMLDSGVDGEGSILFNYGDKEGMVMYSKITNSHVPSEIQGEKGSILINNINTPDKVEIKYNDGTVEDISQPQKSNSMYYEAEAFIDLIKASETESTVNSLKQSYIVGEILEEARNQVGLVFPADNKQT